MAARESQGLQIALIIFVMITVVLSFFTYMFWSKSERLVKEVASAKKSQDDERQKFNTAYFQAQTLKYMIGAPGVTEADVELARQGATEDASFTAVEEKFKQDMVTYGEALGDNTQRNYSSLPAHLLATIKNRNDEKATAVDRANVADRNREKTMQDETARSQTFDKARQDAEARLAADQKTFQDERNRYINDRNADQEQLGKMRAAYGQLETASKEKEEGFTQSISSLRNLIQGYKSRLEEEADETYEIPDGRITLINQPSRTVWINVGLADGLRRGTNFRVYPHDETGIAKPSAIMKGRIEVIRLIDQHLAEARILEDEYANPILPGDAIHSPTWRAGRRVRFALAGIFDMDGDGKDDDGDRDIFRNLITMNGGLIDAELHADGTRTGNLTPQTRYLIKGDVPGVTATAEEDAAKQATQYSVFIQEAQDLGIKPLTQDELLSYMGWKGNVQTVQLGRGSTTPTNVPARANGGQPAGSENGGAGAFRERQPPSRGNNGAF